MRKTMNERLLGIYVFLTMVFLARIIHPAGQGPDLALAGLA